MTTEVIPGTEAPAVPPAAPPAEPKVETPPAKTEIPPKEEPAPKTETEPTPENWENTGNAVVDGAAKAFLKAGGKLDELTAIYNDVQATGVFSAQARATLERVLGDTAAIAIPGLEREATAHREWAAAETKKIHDSFGGEAKWKETAAWAKENLSDAQRKQINIGLDLGGEHAAEAVAYLKYIMRQKGATVSGEQHKVENTETVTGDDFITRAAYIEEKGKLVAKGDYEGIKNLEVRARKSLATTQKNKTRW